MSSVICNKGFVKLGKGRACKKLGRPTAPLLPKCGALAQIAGGDTMVL
jgi:hypothetical protein